MAKIQFNLQIILKTIIFVKGDRVWMQIILQRLQGQR